ncbi:MAG: peptidase M61 [Cyclobacteriaceae bacterium]|nr:MAG: peptidase M61 [Cyclobacteriaceae bacterium]
MQYTISYQNPLTHFVDIEVSCNAAGKHLLNFLIPAWRPGRYELSNYAENISSFNAVDENGDHLPFKKTSRNCWQVATRGIQAVNVKYQFYANQINAGGSMLDDQQLYLNFINCLMYLEHQIMEPCLVSLKINPAYKIACGLPNRNSRQLIARDYYHLVDSPMIASDKLKHWKFQQHGVSYNLWFMGSHRLYKPRVIKAFKSFIRAQTETMGGFPEPNYHFLFQVPATKIYHGVEHTNSTVISLGPGSELHKTRYHDFLGISSHELFHVWNIKKIRPKGLLPYNFKAENYFEEGFVAEGLTTYYGDLFLVKSGVIDLKQYFKELNKLFKRHFENDGRHYSSLVESSRDLWVNGYSGGDQRRKVSIYGKGAIVGLMLDLSLRRISQNQYSLDDVMRHLWKQFGNTDQGYSVNNIEMLCTQLSGENFKTFFHNFIYGVTPLESELNSLLDHVGCYLVETPSKQSLKKLFGIWGSSEDEGLVIKQIDATSPAWRLVAIGDVITKINGKHVTKNLNKLLGKSSTLRLQVNRKGRKLRISVPRGKAGFFLQYKVAKQQRITEEQRSNFRAWLNHKF